MHKQKYDPSLSHPDLCFYWLLNSYCYFLLSASYDENIHENHEMIHESWNAFLIVSILVMVSGAYVKCRRGFRPPPPTHTQSLWVGVYTSRFCWNACVRFLPTAVYSITLRFACVASFNIQKEHIIHNNSKHPVFVHKHISIMSCSQICRFV